MNSQQILNRGNLISRNIELSFQIKKWNTLPIKFPMLFHDFMFLTRTLRNLARPTKHNPIAQRYKAKIVRTTPLDPTKEHEIPERRNRSRFLQRSLLQSPRRCCNHATHRTISLPSLSHHPPPTTHPPTQRNSLVSANSTSSNKTEHRERERENHRYRDFNRKSATLSTRKTSNLKAATLKNRPIRSQDVMPSAMVKKIVSIGALVLVTSQTEVIHTA